ncbi:PAS domain S-box protein [candidate division WOR-3 bacterium]|nr:PAS domain S-box protein [candidate division WOR-3 bacterium]
MKKIFTSLSPTPPKGFKIKELTKKELLGYQVAVFADSLKSFLENYEIFKNRICGTVLTYGENFGFHQITPTLWNLTFPKSRKDLIYDIANNALDIIDVIENLSKENTVLKIEIQRENLNLKNSWNNYSETIDKLGLRIEDLRREIVQREKAESDLKHRVDFESLTSETTAKLLNSTSFDSQNTVKDVLEQIAFFTKSISISIFEIENREITLSFLWKKNQEDDNEPIPAAYHSDEENLFFSAMKNLQIVFVSDNSKNAFSVSNSGFFKLFGEKNSILSIPVEISEEAKGFICYERDSEKGPLKDEDIKILKFLGETIFEFKEKCKFEEMLKDSETRFRKITEMLPESIIETDQTGLIKYANKKFFDLFGYDEEDLKKGIYIFDLIDDDQKEGAIKEFSERLITKDVTPFEYKGKKKDSTYFPGVFSGFFDKDKKSGIVVRGIILDLTQIKNAEEERLKLKKMESIGLLAGGIAHDFNNLLMGIFGNIEIAKMMISPEDKPFAFLETAEQALQNAKSLTKQLLTFSKGGEPVKETLSLGKIVLETAEFSIRGSNVKLVSQIEEDLWQVEADKSQICQVISNLTINAQQSMPEGGEIQLLVKNQEESEGKKVKIVIKDSGIGIAKNHLDKVFDPYFTTKQHGSGLGLSISHSIISKHGGSIHIISDIGKGTTVTVLLPAKENTETNSEIWERPSDDNSNENLRILILEDDVFIKSIIESMLRSMGHQAVTKNDGFALIEEYKKSINQNTEFDILICDLTIPGSLGGKEVAQRILQTDPLAKMIVMSGYATDPIMSNFRSYGFKARLPKPFNFEELKRSIFQAMQNPDPET